GAALAQRGHVGLRRAEPRDDAVRMPQEDAPGVRDRDGPGPARAVDEALADKALERRDLLADGRLRVPQPGGGAAEAALLGDRLQGRQVAQLDPEPMIRLHYRPPSSEHHTSSTSAQPCAFLRFANIRHTNHIESETDLSESTNRTII